MERSRGVGGVGGFLGIAYDGVGKLVDWLVDWLVIRSEVAFYGYNKVSLYRLLLLRRTTLFFF